MKPRKPKKPKVWPAPLCMHCNAPARLTTGGEVYPGRVDLTEKKIWVCACGARVGCHGTSTRALGRPANSELRDARTKLHNLRVDPLWKGAVTSGAYKPEDGRAAHIIQTAARSRVYAFLAASLGLEISACHISLFDLETCRRAWRALDNVTYPMVRAWAIRRKITAALKDHEGDVQALKHVALDVCSGCRVAWPIVDGRHAEPSGEACAALTLRAAIAAIEAAAITTPSTQPDAPRAGQHEETP